MAYTTYENRANPHVTIHRDGCMQLRKHGGVQSHSRAKYVEHATREQAQGYANSTGLPVIWCSFCIPDRSGTRSGTSSAMHPPKATRRDVRSERASTATETGMARPLPVGGSGGAHPPSLVGPVVLISCVKSKRRQGQWRARDLFISAWFRKALAYAESLNPKAIYILSGKYGLLELEELVEWYDVTVNSMTAREAWQWAQRVIARLSEKAVLAHDHFVVLAGTKYRRFIVPHLRPYEIPMEGLTQGRQLSWLKAELGQ